MGAASLAAGQQLAAAILVNRAEFIAKYPTSLNGSDFIEAVLATIQSASGVSLATQKAAPLNLYNQAGGGTAGRAAVIPAGG